jgi:integrase
MGGCRLRPHLIWSGENRAAQIRVLVLLMRHTGLRIGDACTLERNRIHHGLLTLRAEKGGTEVRVPVHPDAVGALNEIPKSSPYCFWSGESKRRTVVDVWEDSKAMFKRAGVGGHSHQLRHSPWTYYSEELPWNTSVPFWATRT